MTIGSYPSQNQVSNAFKNTWRMDYASSGQLMVSIINGGLAGSDAAADLSSSSTDGINWALEALQPPPPCGVL